jgi:hypothetical protein
MTAVTAAEPAPLDTMIATPIMTTIQSTPVIPDVADVAATTMIILTHLKTNIAHVNDASLESAKLSKTLA